MHPQHLVAYAYGVALVIGAIGAMWLMLVALVAALVLSLLLPPIPAGEES